MIVIESYNGQHRAFYRGVDGNSLICLPSNSPRSGSGGSGGSSWRPAGDGLSGPCDGSSDFRVDMSRSSCLGSPILADLRRLLRRSSNAERATRATNTIHPMIIPATEPPGRPEADEVFAGVEAVMAGPDVEDVGLTVEFGKNRERTSALVHCIDEFEFLKRR